MKRIRYQIQTMVNGGTETDPQFLGILSDTEITCTDDRLEANLAIAKSEAYEGKVTIEEGEIEVPTTITVPLATGLEGTLTATRQDGHLSLRCEATGPVVAGGIIAVLPEGWRSEEPITVPVAVPGAAGATVTVSTDGTIRPSAAGNGCWVTI